ncbi:metalloregulator ArsR/SmtB family transcription factor [uncultured Paraglaciecola sp.]|uniref:ArsR/SmtB family transcription factor n=1 Tax=uncultured Paraglaciecola sp. TaxID=1765024 RepID=UPI0030D79D22|tara:strand:+ start:93387 stop:93704 length:318 start_codon:yes stop_codon:yes gene_type:complete
MDIFTALADPQRRNIIEALHSRGKLSIKQLTMDSAVTRQAITKHLNILIKAKIVQADFIGKERIHKLNPKAMQSLFNWLAPFAQKWDDRLNNLAKYIGDQDENTK